MLVLSRHKNEAIIITPPGLPPIRVVVVDIRDGGKVRIGVEAQPDVVVDREEVAHRKRVEGVTGRDANRAPRPLPKYENSGAKCDQCRKAAVHCRCAVPGDVP